MRVTKNDKKNSKKNRLIALRVYSSRSIFGQKTIDELYKSKLFSFFLLTKNCEKNVRWVL
jgi:hypothetical protein